MKKSRTKKPFDISGQKFGDLIAIKISSSGKYRQTYWLCKCICGNTTNVQIYKLTKGYITHCGCKKYSKRIGQRFSSLTILSYTKVRQNGQSEFLCKCICGKEINVEWHRLTSNEKKHCGCLDTRAIPDISGQRFGLWLVLKKLNKKSAFICQCDCGKIKQVNYFFLINKKSTSCGCKLKDKKSHMGISRWSWRQIQHSGKKREFTITIEYVWDLFEKQNGKCALTGLALEFAEDSSAPNRKKQTASLDRINPLNGYIEGNVQWVHKDVNRMKLDFSMYYFIKLCNLISRTHKFSQVKDEYGNILAEKWDETHTDNYNDFREGRLHVLERREREMLLE